MTMDSSSYQPQQPHPLSPTLDYYGRPLMMMNSNPTSPSSIHYDTTPCVSPRTPSNGNRHHHLHLHLSPTSPTTPTASSIATPAAGGGLFAAAATSISPAVSPSSLHRTAHSDNDLDDPRDTALYKREIDVHRERGANMRALKLLDSTVGGVQLQHQHATTALPAKTMTTVRQAAVQQHSLSPPTSPGRHSPSPSTSPPRTLSPTTIGLASGLTARQAAIRHHEAKLLEKGHEKARAKEEVQKFLPPKKLHLHDIQAETTRKKPVKQNTDNDKDPATDFGDTIADYKVKMHYDREKEARSKALRLLNEGYPGMY